MCSGMKNVKRGILNLIMFININQIILDHLVKFQHDNSLFSISFLTGIFYECGVPAFQIDVDKPVRNFIQFI
jgi:hypothetical protein